MAKGKEIRRSFSREFKLEAVRRVKQRPEGVSLAHVGRELGVRPDLLKTWTKQLDGEPSATRKLRSADDEELRRLRRENLRLQQENEFLKKAAAYFAREER